MRRCSLLSLVALLVVALLATVLITPTRTMAATPSLRGLPAPSKDFSPATTFKGRLVAKNSPTNYVVLSFTCSGGGLTIADWTYEVSSTQSFTGTLVPPAQGAPPIPCALVSGTIQNAVTYVGSSIPLLFNGVPVTTTGTPPQAKLTLTLTNIVASKTYFGHSVAISSTVTEDCFTSAPVTCVGITTDDPLTLTISTSTTPPTTVTVAGFKLGGGSTSTLNLSEQ